MKTLKGLARKALRSIWWHTPPGMNLQTAREVAQTVTLALTVLVLTGAKTVEQMGPGVPPGVSETGIYITLPIYITSLLVVGTGCFTLGRWTSNLQRDLVGAIQRQSEESARAEAENLKLRSQISQLDARLEALIRNNKDT